MAYSDILRTDTFTASDIADKIDGLIPLMQNSSYNYGGISTGSANVHAISVSQAPSAYANGQRFTFRAGYTNTATATLDVNSLGAVTLNSIDTMAALAGGEIIVNRLYDVIYYSSVFYLINPSNNIGVNFYGGTSTGSANAQAITLPNAILAYKDGQIVTFRAGYTNTGAATLAVNGLSAITIFDNTTRAALVGGEITASSIYECVYYSSNFYLLNPIQGQSIVWSPTVGGFSANPTNPVFTYQKIGRLCTLFVAGGSAGTSNATTYTYTAPFAAATRTNMEWKAPLAQGFNNGAFLTVPGLAKIVSGSSTINLYTTQGEGAWTASAGKVASFTLTYETAS